MNGECTLNERWVNAEWTMSERWTQVAEGYVNAEREWTRTERKRKRNMNRERTMNERWTFYSESLRYFPCIVLNPKFGKNLHVWVIKLVQEDSVKQKLFIND